MQAKSWDNATTSRSASGLPSGPVKTIIQRVSRAQLRVAGEVVAEIDRGVVALVGVERGDGIADAQMTARKLGGLRMFPGPKPMDRSLVDIGGAALVVSQFTLAADLRKGRRPSFNDAEDPAKAEPLYLAVVEALREQGIPTQTGVFGAHMEVELVNDGPVTLMILTADGVIS